MKLSIVIVNYNVEYFLEQCLNSALIAMKGIDAELFVVDNNSVDGSIAMINDRFPQVKLLANKENLGFSKANNQAMRMASGEYILLLNPDTVIQEDTLRKVVTFMDNHPDAGGLGVKMVDGKGEYLPESKRGLPTPEVAFYKIFGLTALFPKSGRFAKYYLGNLDKESINEIEILSGAFMLMRKDALDKVGLLDEAFFMYGEDIDLSWRIIQGGYKNYYFPETTIIHYKGESTKKGSLNYVFVFYNAMIIFARKHFSQERARMFSFFIHLAIYIRAAAAVIVRTVKSVFLPLLDLGLILLVLFGAKEIYTNYSGIEYPLKLIQWGFLSYSLVWIISVWLSGGYDKPISLWRIIRGVLLGSTVVLIGYALLPEDLRFSRALILLGSLGALGTYLISRVIFHFIHPKKFSLATKKSKRFGVVGSESEFERVGNLLKQTSNEVGAVIPITTMPSDASPEYLDEFIRVYKLNEIIFCAKDISAQQIISLMSNSNQNELDYKIAPPESLYLIGSNSIDTAGDLIVLDTNSVARASNKRIKRLFDVLITFWMIPISPILLLFVSNRIGFIRNIFKVILGSWSWVGYKKSSSGFRLPPLNPGVLNPASGLDLETTNSDSIDRLNMIYAKDYRLKNDVVILWRAWRKLGDKPSVIGENS